MSTLPLFPLNTVLFPTTPIQLHIFEPRYLQMIQACVEKKEHFGVLLIRKGSEAFGPLAETFEVGCTASIYQLKEQTDGTYDLIAMGQERFRVQSLDYHSYSYLSGNIDLLPTYVENRSELLECGLRLRSWIEKYLQILIQAGSIEEGQWKLPEDPLELGYLGAAVIQVHPRQKQALLELEEGSQMLSEIETMYRREIALLRATVRGSGGQTQGSFSQN